MGVTIRRGLLVLAVCVVTACSGSTAADGTDTGESPTATDDGAGHDATVSTGEMRDVPTVPPSTIDGQTAAESDGVIVAAPTIAPPDPGVDNRDRPVDPVAPPTTDLIGDPQPSPDSPSPSPLPLPDGSEQPEACVLLADFEVRDLIGSLADAAATEERIDARSCRYVAGAVTAEVHFLPIPSVRDDWYRRDGIEPVGEVGGDAVGFDSFVPPSGRAGSGYTIAVTGGRDGAVVAVTGPDARLVAAEVTLLVQQAAG